MNSHVIISVFGGEIHISPNSVHCSYAHPVATLIPRTQIVVLKYHFPVKETRA